MSRRVLAHMVARNEEGRFLQCVLAALAPHVDAVHVYDDLSTDDTVGVAMSAGAVVHRRPPLVPSFTENEGLFRQGAWLAFEEYIRPCPGDWVLAIDADELLVAPAGLGPAVDAAAGSDVVAVQLPIPEAFELAVQDELVQPLVRVDGFWGGLKAPRLFAYQDDGRFEPKPLAGGSVPTYVSRGWVTHDNQGVELLHLGYVDPADRAEKLRRYGGRGGHASSHVASIVTAPTLRQWAGGPLPIWRGRV